MSHSFILSILLTIVILTRFVFHFHETFSMFCIGIIGFALIWDLMWNEILPRIFPNSFMTYTITLQVNNKQPSRHGVEQ